MRTLLYGAIISLAVGINVTAQAQTTDPQMMVPINKFLEAFNKGDVAGAAATHSSKGDVVIIDEVPPFTWRGAQAVQTWAADLEADAKKRVITNQSVTLSAATRVETNGVDAYVVVPAVYNFQEKGVAMRESAQMTFSLKKEGAGWLIYGWAWTGPKPQKAAGKTQK